MANLAFVHSRCRDKYQFFSWKEKLLSSKPIKFLLAINRSFVYQKLVLILFIFGSFQYSGLVTPVNKVWTEKVTGHQVMLVWKHRHDRQKAHFLPPDSYQVTWWPGETAEGSTHSNFYCAVVLQLILLSCMIATGKIVCKHTLQTLHITVKIFAICISIRRADH